MKVLVVQLSKPIDTTKIFGNLLHVQESNMWLQELPRFMRRYSTRDLCTPDTVAMLPLKRTAYCYGDL